MSNSAHNPHSPALNPAMPDFPHSPHPNPHSPHPNPESPEIVPILQIDNSPGKPPLHIKLGYALLLHAASLAFASGGTYALIKRDVEETKLKMERMEAFQLDVLQRLARIEENTNSMKEEIRDNRKR
jgi:hypothetical protein